MAGQVAIHKTGNRMFFIDMAVKSAKKYVHGPAVACPGYIDENAIQNNNNLLKSPETLAGATKIINSLPRLGAEARIGAQKRFQQFAETSRNPGRGDKNNQFFTEAWRRSADRRSEKVSTIC